MRLETRTSVGDPTRTTESSFSTNLDMIGAEQKGNALADGSTEVGRYCGRCML
jgi:hypothetical protein